MEHLILERPARYKRPSILPTYVNYGRKTFYYIGPREMEIMSEELRYAMSKASTDVSECKGLCTYPTVTVKESQAIIKKADKEPML